MLSIRLGKEIEDLLTSLSKRTGRTKSFYVKRIIEENISALEDMEDALDYDEAMKNFNKDDYVSFEEVLKENGMEDIHQQKRLKSAKKAPSRRKK